ncbi:hypothetical protein EVAR_18898_1 [Eumeta japonica]|uniref:Gustatory receptor n=1 Tax=Eumeta variegata TaxID=151549 RepID=A0A4C1V336_EUMVA|nr:hypothetical protein EVAR_18898_1 [Eumeta japonica]
MAVAPFAPLVNTLVKPKILEIDKIMKLYLLIEAMMGVDRLVLCEDLHKYMKYCLRIFALLLNISVIVVSVLYPCLQTAYTMILVFCIAHYHLYAVIALIYKSDLRRFLVVLQKFDKLYPEIDLKKLQRYGKKYFRVVALLFIFFGCNVLAYLVPVYYLRRWQINDLLLQVLPFQFINIVESMLCTHLLKLLSQRIDLIVNALEELNMEQKDEGISVIESNDTQSLNGKYNLSMGRIKDSYKIIVEATELVQTVVKCQIIAMLVLQFVPALMTWYLNVAVIISNVDGWWLIVLCSSCIALMMLYFQTTPCLVSDQINAKVEKITASLAQLLCSAHLDKKERLSTRTFLSYVEQHDLRFRLLRVADVGVSLPLQYVTLLVTYLIIMLQFGKLIDQHLYTT